MAVNQTSAGAGAVADEQLVRVLEETAVHKVLEKLEGPLQAIVHEAVAEAIVHAIHQEPPVSMPRRRGRKAIAPTQKRVKKGGGVCQAVWKELDRMTEKAHATPALQEILKVGERRSWNPNNTRVEYYQWRKAHGISGRQTPAPEQAAAH